jgi:hypothetical protein
MRLRYCFARRDSCSDFLFARRTLLPESLQRKKRENVGSSAIRRSAAIGRWSISAMKPIARLRAVRGRRLPTGAYKTPRPRPPTPRAARIAIEVSRGALEFRERQVTGDDSSAATGKIWPISDRFASPNQPFSETNPGPSASGNSRRQAARFGRPLERRHQPSGGLGDRSPLRGALCHQDNFPSPHFSCTSIAQRHGFNPPATHNDALCKLSPIATAVHIFIPRPHVQHAVRIRAEERVAVGEYFLSHGRRSLRLMQPQIER